MTTAVHAVRPKAAPPEARSRAPSDQDRINGTPRYLRDRINLGGVHDPEERAAQAAGQLWGPIAQATPAGNPGLSPADGQLGAAMSSPGVPLPPPERAWFEQRLGAGLSHVRLHADAAAGVAAKSVGARAFALGNRIGFAQGAYRPDTPDGRGLIGHEIAHTLQPGAERTVRRQPEANVSEMPEPVMLGPYIQDIPGGAAGLALARQYGRLQDRLPPEQWEHLAKAAGLRAESQEALGKPMSGPDSPPCSISVPLGLLLEPAARFVDVDSWDTLFTLFYQADKSPTAAILIRNEIARRWFRRNAINTDKEMVTISLIDPEGVEHGPAQLRFEWRKRELTDSLGGIELTWLDEDLGGMRFTLRDTVHEVKTEAAEIGEAAALKAQADQLAPKVRPIMAKARTDLRTARLAEIEAYHTVFEEGATRSYVLERSMVPAQYIPGLYSLYKETASELFVLLGQVRDFRLGKEVLGQKQDVTQRFVKESLGFPHSEDPVGELYVSGQISQSELEDLDEAIANRSLIVNLVTIAVSMVTFGVGGFVAEGIGLTEGTLIYGAVATGTDMAVANVTIMGTEHIVTALKDFDNPAAEALWRQGAHSVGDYFKAAGLGFIAGAAIVFIVGAGIVGWRAWKARASMPGGSVPPDEPPFTVLSDIHDETTNVRTWQLRTVDGDLVTVSADAETGSGYIWHAGTGELRQIINGELGGTLRALGSSHAEYLAQIDQLLRAGPGAAVRPTEEAVAAARAAAASGDATAADLDVLVRKAVDDFRVMRSTRKGPLTPEAVCLSCGTGRDYSASSLGSMLHGGEQTAVIRRHHTSGVFRDVNSSGYHSFATVDFGGNPPVRFLIDPTVAQFMEAGAVTEATGHITANVMRLEAEGSRFMRDLLRDGYVPLDQSSAMLYARALGVPEDHVATMAERLVRGDDAVLTETVGGGHPGLVTQAGVDAPDFLEVEFIREEVADRMKALGGVPEAATELRLLEDYLHRLDEVMGGAPVPWDPHIHGGFFPNP